MPQPPTTTELVRQVREALERNAAALVRADLTALLQGEADLELVIRRGGPRPVAEPGDAAALRQEIAAAQRALARCRRLGGALLDVVRCSFEAQGLSSGYGRAPLAPPARRTLDQRV